jgi:hypothetical protein
MSAGRKESLNPSVTCPGPTICRVGLPASGGALIPLSPPRLRLRQAASPLLAGRAANLQRRAPLVKFRVYPPGPSQAHGSGEPPGDCRSRHPLGGRSVRPRHLDVNRRHLAVVGH